MPKAYNQHLNNLPWSLALTQDGNEIGIVAVDDEGDTVEHLGLISESGILWLAYGISDETAHKTGLARNAKGQIKVSRA